MRLSLIIFAMLFASLSHAEDKPAKGFTSISQCMNLKDTAQIFECLAARGGVCKTRAIARYFASN